MRAPPPRAGPADTGAQGPVSGELVLAQWLDIGSAANQFFDPLLRGLIVGGAGGLQAHSLLIRSVTVPIVVRASDWRVPPPGNRKISPVAPSMTGVRNAPTSARPNASGSSRP